MSGLQQQVAGLIRQQTENWPLLKKNYTLLQQTKIKCIPFDGFDFEIQYNPERVRSITATGKAAEKQSRCFLCPENQPPEEQYLPFRDNYRIMCNPYPVMPDHLTIASSIHTPQSILNRFDDLLELGKELPGFVVFYNGPRSGASAPDHMHFQAACNSAYPLFRDFDRLVSRYRTGDGNETAFTIRDSIRTFTVLQHKERNYLNDCFQQLFLPGGTEPDFNILAWYKEDKWQICVFRRAAHRPCQYYESGEKQLLVSPGAVEMAGLIVTAREEDFLKLSKEELQDIFRQVIDNKTADLF